MTQILLDPTFIAVRSWIGASLILIGAGLTLVAAIGVALRADPYERMHAASKPQFLGLILLCAGIVAERATWLWVCVAAAVLLVQFVTAPVGSHLVARAFDRFHRLDESEEDPA